MLFRLRLRSLLFYCVVLGLTLPFGNAHAQTQPPFFGVTVQHFKGDVLRGVPQLPTKKTIQFKVLSVYPQPTPEGLYVGVDPAKILPLFQNNPAETLNRVSQHFMNIIQNAYFKIASDRGLLKMGGAFQKELASKEPFWDGRSSAIAVFEGDDFSRPLATFRVSYSTPHIRNYHWKPGWDCVLQIIAKNPPHTIYRKRKWTRRLA